MSHFRKLVNDNEDSIISALGLWKTSHEVYFDMIKLPFRDSKRLEETSWSLVFRFHSSTDITFIHELGNFSLHSSPPIRLLEVMVHLRTSRMNGKERIVSLVHDHFTKVTFGYNNTILEEESVQR